MIAELLNELRTHALSQPGLLVAFSLFLLWLVLSDVDNRLLLVWPAFVVGVYIHMNLHKAALERAAILDTLDRLENSLKQH